MTLDEQNEILVKAGVRSVSATSNKGTFQQWKLSNAAHETVEVENLDLGEFIERALSVETKGNLKAYKSFVILPFERITICYGIHHTHDYRY